MGVIVVCTGNCYACPFACNVGENKKRPNSYIVKEPVEAKIEPQRNDNSENGIIPLYEVKKTITGKLKGVLRGEQ